MAAALPANSHADPNVRAALGRLRRCLETPMLTQGANRPAWEGCGFACEPPCWTAKLKKAGGAGGAAAFPANLHAGPAQDDTHISRSVSFFVCEPQRRRSRGQLDTLDEPAELAGQVGFCACLAFLVLVSWVLFCFVCARVSCLSGRGLPSSM